MFASPSAAISLLLRGRGRSSSNDRFIPARAGNWAAATMGHAAAPAIPVMNSRRRIDHPPGRFIGSLSRPRVQGNGLSRGRHGRRLLRCMSLLLARSGDDGRRAVAAAFWSGPAAGYQPGQKLLVRPPRLCEWSGAGRCRPTSRIEDEAGRGFCGRGPHSRRGGGRPRSNL
jgi:hypothetical protein